MVMKEKLAEAASVVLNIGNGDILDASYSAINIGSNHLSFLLLDLLSDIYCFS